MTSRIGQLALGTASPVSEGNGCEHVDDVSLPREPGGSLLGQLKLRFKPDEDLMQRLRSGEADALTILFHRHHALIFRIAHRVLRNEAEAEDAVQQVFLDLYRSAEQFDPAKGRFKSWLLMFAYHRTFNKRRSLLANRFYDTQEIGDVVPELLAGAARPLAFSAAETKVLIEQCLAVLQPRQRRTIELVYYEGLTAEEVSGQTGESVRVVRHNLYRGLEKLRSLLCRSRSDIEVKPETPKGRVRI